MFGAIPGGDVGVGVDRSLPRSDHLDLPRKRRRIGGGRGRARRGKEEPSRGAVDAHEDPGLGARPQPRRPQLGLGHVSQGQRAGAPRRRGGPRVDPQEPVGRHPEHAVLEAPREAQARAVVPLLLLFGRRHEDEVGPVMDEALGLAREQDGPARRGELQGEEADGEGRERGRRGRRVHRSENHPSFFQCCSVSLSFFWCEGLGLDVARPW